MSQGYRVTLAGNGAVARRVWADDPPDLVLLDLGLPDADGIDLCRTFRSGRPEASIIVLTARQEEADIVLGLDAGADDYVTKPFRLAELLARVRAQLRQPNTEVEPSILEVGDLHIDVAARQVLIGDDEVNLRPREFDLLVLLVTETGRAITRARIMEAVWDEHWFGSTKTLDVHISSIRRKLNSYTDRAVPRIVALPRVGYRLDVP